MKIRSIRIKEGLAERVVNFSDRVNLIHSKENSKGKTTLMRFLLYSLGYNIPNTKKIKFERCEVESHISTEFSGELVLARYSLDHIIVNKDGENKTYVLPAQLHEVHELIFGTNNRSVLNNLLGAFYVDQEKGWTLLNRGVVIGSNRFNIEELIRGLANCDCSELIRQEAQLSRELSKYRQMFSVAKYRESIIEESGSLLADNYEVEMDVALSQLLIEHGKLQKELKRIDKTLNENRHFQRFVAQMKLVVRTANGEVVPVTENNIVGLTDTIDYLIAKRKIVATSLAELSQKITNARRDEEKEVEQLSFLSSESLIEAFDRKIAAVPINAVAIEREIDRLEKMLKAIRQEISAQTRANTQNITSLYKNIVKYATELGVGDSESIATPYLFTSNLKELSGAVLHKTVFAFRLAYIIEIEKTLGIKLPIMLDSPSGKEVDPVNIQLMVNILKRDFADNQIIIASIFEYDFEEVKLIEIKNRLIEI